MTWVWAAEAGAAGGFDTSQRQREERVEVIPGRLVCRAPCSLTVPGWEGEGGGDVACPPAVTLSTRLPC